ncbi:Hypothetical predicted protein, partial [Mytilus galloprovincialis]
KDISGHDGSILIFDPETQSASTPLEKTVTATQQCDKCGKTYQTTQGLRVHKKREHEEPPFSCAQCPKKYVSRTLFRSHVLNHVQVNFR